MSQLSINSLYQAMVTRLEDLTGQDVDITGASNHRLLQYMLLLMNQLELGDGSGGPAVDQAARDAASQAQQEVDALELVVAALSVEDSAPLPEDVETPPAEPSDPDLPIVDPVIIAEDDYIPDLTAFSAYNRPRLSASGTPDFFPASATGTPGNLQFFGLRIAPSAQVRTFQRLEVPLRAKNVLGGETFGLHVMRKVGESWVSVASRYLTLVKNAARVPWNKTVVIPPGEEWAIVFGLNSGDPNVFYGSTSQYPAPFAGHGVGVPGGMGSTVGKVWELQTGVGNRMIRLYGVTLPKDVVGPLEAVDLPASLMATIASLSASAGGKSLRSFNQAGTSPFEAYYLPMVVSYQAITASLLPNFIYAVPFFVGRSGRIDRLAVQVTSAASGSSVRLGIYANQAQDKLYPTAKLLDAGAVATVSNGVKTITVDHPLEANTLYWMVLHASAALSVRGFGGPQAALEILGVDPANFTNLRAGLYASTPYGSALPDTFPAGSAPNTDTMPVTGVRYSQ